MTDLEFSKVKFTIARDLCISEKAKHGGAVTDALRSYFEVNNPELTEHGLSADNIHEWTWAKYAASRGLVSLNTLASEGLVVDARYLDTVPPNLLNADAAKEQAEAEWGIAPTSLRNQFTSKQNFIGYRTMVLTGMFNPAKSIYRGNGTMSTFESR